MVITEENIGASFESGGSRFKSCFCCFLGGGPWTVTGLSEPRFPHWSGEADRAALQGPVCHSTAPDVAEYLVGTQPGAPAHCVQPGLCWGLGLSGEPMLLRLL